MVFGISGKLYENNVLLYDKETESLWLQLKNEAVAGPLTGAKLQLLPFEETTWGKWLKKHPNTLVLSQNTGYRRDYGKDPYENYYRSDRTLFSVENENRVLPKKERVIGIGRNGKYKAYPFEELKGIQNLKDTISGETITIQWDEKNKTAVVQDVQGSPIPYVVSFWYAWYNFHPDTEIYRKEKFH